MTTAPSTISNDLTALFGDARADDAIATLQSRARLYTRSDVDYRSLADHALNIATIDGLYKKPELTQSLARTQYINDRGNVALSLPLSDVMYITKVMQKHTVLFDNGVLNHLIRKATKGDYAVVLPLANNAEITASVKRLSEHFGFMPKAQIHSTANGSEVILTRAQYQTLTNEWQKQAKVDAHALLKDAFSGENTSMASMIEAMSYIDSLEREANQTGVEDGKIRINVDLKEDKEETKATAPDTQVSSVTPAVSGFDAPNVVRPVFGQPRKR